MKKQLITESDVRLALRNNLPLEISASSIITPAAKDLIRSSDIPIKQSSSGSAQIKHNPSVNSAQKWEKKFYANKKVVGISADHGGFLMKEMIKEYVIQLGFEVMDYGTDSTEKVDYPVYAAAVAKAVAKGDIWRGIIFDSAGIGSAMTANKFKGVRAAQAWDTLTANNCRQHNDANILSLGALLLGITTTKEIVKIFLNTEFEARHQARIDIIEQYEDENFRDE